ncbi:hypothetical protein AM587_10008682 [Phytophthora nicotianae]|uniref:Uncharacterized protein n=1 Tax=Phytophthora nicotianae TaxID=4792 RepID=A0A0W8CJ00_PHYNI|nr:hypothetical protein AM587_10008682 [Phytophthora nicotianae]
MVGTANATEDTPASQDAKTLVPMSLSLVAKKEKILQMEVVKLGTLLSQRNEMLSGLRESHEYLLTTNGQLRERSRLQRARLVSLRTLLGADQEQNGKDKPGLCDNVGVNELEATAEKCGVLKDILYGLVDKRAGLEQQYMGLEEQTAREVVALRSKEERLSEGIMKGQHAAAVKANECYDVVRNSLLLLQEDIRSTQWNFAVNEMILLLWSLVLLSDGLLNWFQNSQAEFVASDKYLNAVSQNAQSQAAAVEKVTTALRAEKAAVEDLRTVCFFYSFAVLIHIINTKVDQTWQNYEDMIHEEHRQLVIENEIARSEQREFQKLLESKGEEITSVKFFKRELALRRKQEKDILAIAQSSIKAKDKQLTWLERQRVHLENEQNEAVKTHAADETAHHTFVEEHNSAITSLEVQTKDIGKKIKGTERAITARNKKVATVNKKVAQKTKVLQEWKARIDAKQDQVTKSAATQEFIDGEALAVQEALNQELRRDEQIQGLLTVQEMESEELRSSCEVLETEIQRANTTLTTMRTSITATQTAVKNRIDEVRDKFLSTFVVGDAENLIELLDKEIESWTVKDTVEVDEIIARETLKLKERYNTLTAETRKTYGRTLRKKEKQYNAKLTKLKEKMAEKKSKVTTNSANKPPEGEESEIKLPVQQVPVAATGHKHELDETMENRAAGENEKQNRELDPSSVERLSNKDKFNKIPPSQKRSSKPHKKQLKATKQTPKSARRGLNLVDESPQTDKEATDLFTVDPAIAAKVTKPTHSNLPQHRKIDNANGVRPRRLKRRTPAQKTGKPEPTFKTASVAQRNPVADPLDSPAGCDEDLEMTRPVQDADTTEMTSSTTSQDAAKKLQLKKADQRCKGSIKRRTFTKATALHRSRHTKASRISFGRTADWSTADSFSFD